MWGSSVDERKLTREDTNRPTNAWHREDPQAGAGELHESRNPEEETDGTWGERDVGGFTTERAMQDYEVCFHSEALIKPKQRLTQHRHLEGTSQNCQKLDPKMATTL